jgi:hypothetical protein
VISMIRIGASEASLSLRYGKAAICRIGSLPQEQSLRGGMLHFHDSCNREAQQSAIICG